MNSVGFRKQRILPFVSVTETEILVRRMVKDMVDQVVEVVQMRYDLLNDGEDASLVDLAIAV